jgi:hypothetical protein
LSDDTKKAVDKNEIDKRYASDKDEIDIAVSAVNTADENGLFKDQTHAFSQVLDKLRAARADLETQNFSQCENNLYQAEHIYFAAAKGATLRWRLWNLYAIHLWFYFVGFLVLIFVFYSFHFDNCNSNSKLCDLILPSPNIADTPTTTNPITNSTQKVQSAAHFIAFPFQLKNNNPSSVGHFDNNTLTRIPQDALYATTWGIVGGILQGLYQLWQHVSDRVYRSPWLIWGISTPFLGGIFGAITYFLISAGLLVVSGTAHSAPNTFAIVVIAGWAGFSWEWFIKTFQKLGDTFTPK